MTNVVDVLQKRGFIEAMTSDEMRALVEKPLIVYCGFDPTSDSLHLGNFVAMMGLAWFQRHGHTPIAILGGATGMIGDPSGKTSERQLLNEETINKNVEGIRKNLETILDFNHPTAKPIILNNFDWFKEFSFVDFLRDIGKYFRIGPMLAKESVKTRINTEEGMSFTEFSYQVLQGYDFLHLYKNYGATLQIGGSDQWGNITAGTELIRKAAGASSYGLTFPLLTRSDGQKFGKSEKGAIWLSSDRLSPYEFFQYLFRISDADVIRLMCMLTFMDIEEINRYEEMMKKPDYIPNTAQKRLAEEVTRLVHGEEKLQIALQVTQKAAPGSETKLDAQVLESIAADMPSQTFEKDLVVGVKLIDFLVQSGLQSSKGEARKLIKNGGAYVNNQKIMDENACLSTEDLIEGRLLLISAPGKKNKLLIRVK